MRAIWKGSISFGLVNIPISLFPATRRDELKFRLLRQRDLSPVNYKRVAESDGKEVPWEEIVKGYEYEPGKYVVLKDEDFKRVDVEATQSVDIIDFVELEEIDPIYFDKPFYLEAQKSGNRGYGLLRDVLRTTGKVGIAKVVIKTRQHLAAVKVKDDVLMLELMHFAEEITDSSNIKHPEKMKFSDKELQMAKTLVQSMTGPWKPEKYSDDYRSALLKLIEEKSKHGGHLPKTATRSKKAPSNVIDLVSVLQESINESKRGGGEKAAKPKKKAHARRMKKAA